MLASDLEKNMRHRSRSLARLLTVLILLASWVVTGRAQTQGAVTGAVTDTSGAPVPGANVTVTNSATTGTRTTVTNGEGVYSFPGLPPGSYQLKVELQGFKTAEIPTFKVDIQQTVRMDVSLQVGALNETVTVASRTVLLNTESTTVGTVIENKVVTELPLNGRQYLNLVALAPNVNVLSPAAGQAGARLGGERAAQAISAGGQRIFFNYFTLDGVNNTDPNFQNYIALPSIDAIQEFKVQTGVYPAEFGHQSTQVNVVTKSGGNQFHGSVFEFLRDEKLDAKPYAFTSVHPAKSPFKWNDYGFEVDGPVRIPGLFDGRDKLFFMGNFEGLRRRQTTLSTFTVPTAKMFNGDFSEVLGTTIVYDPLTGQPFPGNVIPASRIDPISKDLLTYYHSSTLPGLTNNFTQDNSQPFDRKGYVIRADFNESSSSQWMGRYNWGNDEQSSQGIGLAGSKTLTHYKQWGGSNTRTLSSTLVNDARFGYTKFFNSIGTLSAFTNDVVGALKIPNLKSGAPATWGIPDISFTGFNDIGDANDGPFKVDNSTLQFVDKLTWLRGRHTIGMGAEYDRQHFDEIGNQFSRGLYAFQAFRTRNPANNTGGYGFAEFLLGQQFKTTVALAVAEATFVRNVFHAFVDDNWKVTNKLTVLAGLRYELTPPFTNTLGNYFSVHIPTIDYSLNQPQSNYPTLVRQGDNCTDPYAGLSLRWTVTPVGCAKDFGMNNNLRETKYKNFAPRLGATYALGDKTVIRSGVGLYYMEDIGNAEYFDMARITAARVDTQASSTNLVTWANATPGGGVAAVPPTLSWAAAYDHATPRTWQYLVNVERQLATNWSVEVGYLGSQSRHLYGFQTLNQAGPGPISSISSRVPYPTFGVISYVTDQNKGHYNAFSIKATRRYGDGLSLTTSYTLAKSIDNSSGTRTQGYDTLFPQDSRCMECETGPSSFDVRHRWVLGAVYELPFGKGKPVNIENGVLDGILGGWQLSTNTTIQSGVPLTLSAGKVQSGTNNLVNDRPSSSGVGDGYAADPSPTRWYDPKSFVLAPEGQFGTVGRNSMVTPHLQQIDAALAKNFVLPNGHRIQARLEAFNVFNHPVWGAPNGNILSGAAFPGAPENAAHQGFGVITSTALPMRQIQLGVKYSF
jgi:Carboxypeptidase regulatory-like domain